MKDMHDRMREEFKRQQEDYQESYQESSKKRLFNIISKKLTTTFIGDISQIEQALGHLWGHNSNGAKLTPEQQKYKKIWENLRNKILNNGNNQLRAIENELKQYNVNWERYHTDLKVADE